MQASFCLIRYAKHFPLHIREGVTRRAGGNIYRRKTSCSIPGRMPFSLMYYPVKSNVIPTGSVRKKAYLSFYLLRFSKKSTCILPPTLFQEPTPHTLEQISMSPSPSTSPTCNSCPPNLSSSMIFSV